MLPGEIDNKLLHQVSDKIATESDLEAIDETVNPLVDKIVEELVAKFGLDESQEEELLERIAWRFELLDGNQ